MGEVLQKSLHYKVWMGEAKHFQRTPRRRIQMKNIRVEDITEQMLKELAKKHSMKENKFIDELVNTLYMNMKTTGRKVL